MLKEAVRTQMRATKTGKIAKMIKLPSIYINTVCINTVSKPKLHDTPHEGLRVSDWLG